MTCFIMTEIIEKNNTEPLKMCHNPFITHILYNVLFYITTWKEEVTNIIQNEK